MVNDGQAAKSGVARAPRYAQEILWARKVNLFANLLK